MIDFIEGEIVSKEPQKLVIKTGGLGFWLKVSNQTLSDFPPVGARALAYTLMQVKEDDISLYGFSSKDERAFFELLIQVSGVGPKLALTILSSFPALTVKKAIVAGDIAVLSSVSGIGKKTAQRIVLELKDKIGKELMIGGEAEAYGLSGHKDDGGAAAQAMEALEALGYPRSDIIRAFADKDVSELDVEGIIRLGLRLLARF